MFPLHASLLLISCKFYTMHQRILDSSGLPVQAKYVLDGLKNNVMTILLVLPCATSVWLKSTGSTSLTHVGMVSEFI